MKNIIKNVNELVAGNLYYLKCIKKRNKLRTTYLLYDLEFNKILYVANINMLIMFIEKDREDFIKVMVEDKIGYMYYDWFEFIEIQ